MKNPHQHKRSLGLRVPSAVLLTLVMQGAAVVIWATQLDARVSSIEQQGLTNSQLSEKFARLDERLEGMKRDIGDVKQQLGHLLDQLMKNK